EEAAQTYVNVKPLVDEAYAEVGQPDGSFDRTLVRAAQMLRATPDPATPPVVVRRQGYFEFEDPSFQALRPVQKQLLLLGPENRRQVLAWIDRFLRALRLEHRLPESTATESATGHARSRPCRLPVGSPAGTRCRRGRPPAAPADSAARESVRRSPRGRHAHRRRGWRKPC